MIKYLLALLLLIMPFPVMAQQQTSPDLKTLEILDDQFYWLLQIYLDSPCQDKISIVTEKRTLLMEQSKLIDSLRFIRNEMERIKSNSNPVPLEEIIDSKCPNLRVF